MPIVVVILVQDEDFQFPSETDLRGKYKLPLEKGIFEGIPLIRDQPLYAVQLWKEVMRRIENQVTYDYIRSVISQSSMKKVSRTSFFLSHKQSSGQGIALALYLELKKRGYSPFLDIQAEFDLHNLRKNCGEYRCVCIHPIQRHT